jgi:hypothetical protein
MRKTLQPSKNRTFSPEFAAEMLGVPGRMFPRIYDDANRLFVSQVFKASRPFKAQGFKAGSTITVEVRFDDECKNGNQSFAITGNVREPGARDSTMCGCIHEEIAKFFPELAPLIQWHLFDTSGPMHYVANTAYHASDRDHNGRAAGEPSAWDLVIKFGSFPITQKINAKFSQWLTAAKEHGDTSSATNPARVWPPVAVAVEHEKKPGETYDFAPKYTFNGFDCKWYECPFDSLAEAQQFADALKLGFTFEKIPTAYSKGKTRDLAAARSCGVWPDATDAELCAPRADLERALLARLPGLVAAFRADMDKCGLLWEDQPEADAQQ